tara:strand:- start:496 stop:714 length:219 start_codon:yes stop_codon:yes gene_type:complete
MNELNELIDKFKLKDNTLLTRLWINFLLIKKNDIENTLHQANFVLNNIDDIDTNLTYENIITLYNINKFNNT